MSTATGTATLVFVRGKLRPGFDIEVKVSMQVEAADGESLGTAEVHWHEATDCDGGEHEYSVTTTGAAAASIQSWLRREEDAVNGLLQCWAKELSKFA